MRFPRATLALIAAWCAFSPAVRAQDGADTPPPYLARVDGAATLDREDVSEPATNGVPLVPGDRVRTERGRAELLFPDGSALDVDEYSTIELEGPTLLRMTSGRVILFAAGASNPASAAQFQIDTPVASAQTDGPGEYHVSMTGSPSNPQTEMAVVRGGGALVTEVGTTPLRPGERSAAWDNAAPSRPQPFNSARYDAFDQWAMAQRDERLGPRSQSAQYLPADLRMYGGELDRYGSWEYEAPYGNVWYPTVAADWRPYYDGYWAAMPTYGWTWIGVDAWSWPTHHYGRWGYARSRWFWIPDRRWAPAWVSWGGAPGYVSWCPLGFDNRPVFALSVSVGSGYRGWNGWTVVSRDHFGGHRSIRPFAVAPRSLPANLGFVAQRSAPVAPPRAVPRRGFDNRAQSGGERRQFPNVVGRAADGQPRAVPRRDVNGDRVERPAEGRAARPDPPRSTTRSPEAVSRQPRATQTNRPPAQEPQQRSEQGRSGDRSRAVTRQPQTSSGQPPQTGQTPSAQAPQNGQQSSDGGRHRESSRTRQPDAGTTNPNPRENLTSSARPRSERPAVPQAPAQPIGPRASQPFERRANGGATRAEPIRPAQPAQPDPSPRFSRRSGGMIDSQRPTPPQAAAPRLERQQPTPRIERPQAPPRVERSASPRQERPSNEGRSGGHTTAPSSNRQQTDDKGGGNGNGHHRR